jgi:hypothetical protein
MLSGAIYFAGKTLDDVAMAIEEALSRINAGNVMGFDRNEDGNFSFELSGEEEDPEETEDG